MNSDVFEQRRIYVFMTVRIIRIEGGTAVLNKIDADDAETNYNFHRKKRT